MNILQYCLAMTLLLLSINSSLAHATVTNDAVTNSQTPSAYAGFDTPSARITVNNIDASVSEHLDRINLLNYQFTNQAQEQLMQIQQAAKHDVLTTAELLRLELLECYNLLEQGEQEAAINRAKMGAVNAKKQKFDQLTPYFILCEADALNYFGEVKLALPLIDTAIDLAHKYHQVQALVNGLYLRSMIDIQMENYNSALEDLRVALDIYQEAEAQSPAWQLIPKAFVLASMGGLFVSTHDLSQAMFFTDKARADKGVAGKIELLVFFNSALIALFNKDDHLADVYITHGKTLISELSHPVDLASSYSYLAAIDLARGRLDSAEEQITISLAIYTRHKQFIFLARSKRILAQIRFKQGRDEEALALMSQSITLAKNQGQDIDLQEFYAILSQHYADKLDYKSAYDYQLQRFELGKIIASKVNQARFLQFKARLNEHSELTHKASKNPVNQTYLTLQQTYGLIAVGLSLLFASLLFFIKKEPKLNSLTKPVEQQGGEIDTQLLSAKRGGYPLSLLLLNISDVRLVDLGDLQIHLLQTLREQDKLYRHSIDEMIILLPHTSLLGAQRVAKQLSVSIKDWQEASNITIGVASLQQLENLEQLVKKAQLDQLSKKNNRAN
jgi:tetratricopeptide (TPR) repeat protein